MRNGFLQTSDPANAECRQRPTAGATRFYTRFRLDQSLEATEDHPRTDG